MTTRIGSYWTRQMGMSVRINESICLCKWRGKIGRFKVTCTRQYLCKKGHQFAVSIGCFKSWSKYDFSMLVKSHSQGPHHAINKVSLFIIFFQAHYKHFPCSWNFSFKHFAILHTKHFLSTSKHFQALSRQLMLIGGLLRSAKEVLMKCLESA